MVASVSVAVASSAEGIVHVCHICIRLLLSLQSLLQHNIWQREREGGGEVDGKEEGALESSEQHPPSMRDPHQSLLLPPLPQP